MAKIFEIQVLHKVAQPLQSLFMKNNKSPLRRKRYSRIYLKKRQTLVTAVLQSGESLTKVAKRLNIKLATAKLILKKFKITGTFFNKPIRNTKKQTKPITTDSEQEKIDLSLGALEQNQNLHNTNALLNKEMSQNVQQRFEMNMQVFYWWSNYFQQQSLSTWPGYYFVL